MKRLMFIFAAIAGISLYAATYEENMALANLPMDQITAANAQTVIDASLAVTNYEQLSKCREKGFLTYASLAELLKDKPYFYYGLFDNAMHSSNDTIRVACYESLEAFSLTEKPDEYYFCGKLFGLAKFLNLSPARRLETAKKLIAANLPVHAIGILYGGVPTEVMRGTDIKAPYTQEYCDYMRQVYSTCYEAWLATEPTTMPNGRLNDPWNEGMSIVSYVDQARIGAEELNRATEKTSKYCKDGYRLYQSHHTKFHIALCIAYTQSPYIEENFMIASAKIADRGLKTKATTESIWPKLKDDTNKIKVALYLNDVDKLIDVLKTVSDKCNAETIESTISPINAVNAGYRTADIKLALMNINKKYTLKLYDDRDTWEPIISKVRAMIDAL